MRTDGRFDIARIEIPAKNNETWHFIPFGDIHYDSPAFSRHCWDKFLARVKSLMPRVILWGMGDYTDSFSTSERAILIGSRKMHESSLKRMEKEGRARIDALAKELEFAKGHAPIFLGGNHYMEFQNGTTGDQYLAEQLGGRYLGVCGAVRMLFCLGKNSERAALDVFAHHGRGAGQTAGGRMNAVEKLASVADADIYLMGDNHARGALPLAEKLKLAQDTKAESGLRLRHRKQWIARTGSFLKGYEPGESNYVVDGAWAPSSLGWVEFHITPSRRRTPEGRICEIDIKTLV